MTGKNVIIQAHNNAWAEAYTAEASAVRACLGRPELRIEHIGSTAVPGLAAKPVLDIMIGVEKLSEADNWEAWLKVLGYEQVHHPGMPERRFFRKGGRGAGTHHLHVYDMQVRRGLISACSGMNCVGYPINAGVTNG